MVDVAGVLVPLKSKVLFQPAGGFIPKSFVGLVYEDVLVTFPPVGDL